MPYEQMDGLMGERIHEQTGWTDGWTEWIDGWTDGWMNEQMDGLMGERMNRYGLKRMDWWVNE